MSRDAEKSRILKLLYSKRILLLHIGMEISSVKEITVEFVKVRINILLYIDKTYTSTY